MNNEPDRLKMNQRVRFQVRKYIVERNSVVKRVS